MKARRVASALGGTRAGDFSFYNTTPRGERAGMIVICPGCVRPLSLGFDRWTMSGSDDAPTLTPSINHTGCWHGFLRDGEFVAC